MDCVRGNVASCCSNDWSLAPLAESRFRIFGDASAELLPKGNATHLIVIKVLQLNHVRPPSIPWFLFGQKMVLLNSAGSWQNKIAVTHFEVEETALAHRGIQ